MKDYSRKSSELFDSIMSSQMDIDQKNNMQYYRKRASRKDDIIELMLYLNKIFYTKFHEFSQAP